jgi:hypothetical protein
MDRYVGEDAGREVAMRGQPADFYAEAVRRKVTGMVAVRITGKPATFSSNREHARGSRTERDAGKDSGRNSIPSNDAPSPAFGNRRHTGQGWQLEAPRPKSVAHKK